jgi:hypothetical protein
MMERNAGVVSKGVERILGLSADAHIQRRVMAKDSPEYHNLTGAIAAYGKALAVLTALKYREEFRAIIAEPDVRECVTVC